jgi:hypothetical protein
VDAKLKHLEFIEAVISRMATNSFLFKGWAITVAAALSGFAAVDTKQGLLIIALVATLMFWALDGYYLWLERCFVSLYNNVARKGEGRIDFSMKIDKSKALCRWFRTCWRPHLWLFYGAILAADIAGILLIRSK